MKKNVSVISLFVLLVLTIFYTYYENPIVNPKEIPTQEKVVHNSKNLKPVNSTQSNPSNPKTPTELDVLEIKQNQPYIVQCEEIDWASEENKKRSFTINDKLNDYLSTSNLEDDRLIQAIVGPISSNQSNQKLLSQFVKDFPDNKIGQLSLLSQCIAKKSDPISCRSINIEMIENFADDNAMFWFNLALYYDVRQQQNLAEDALKQSLNSPVFSFYYGQINGYINQSFIRAGEPYDAMTKIAAIGYTAAMAIPYLSPFTSLCNSRSEKDFEFYKLCLEVSNALAKKADTMILKNFGEQFAISLKKKHQKLIGVKVDDNIVNYSYYSNHTAKLISFRNLLIYDNQLDDYWFDALIKYGEIQAVDMTYNEAIRLSKNPNYNPCPK